MALTVEQVNISLGEEEVKNNINTARKVNVYTVTWNVGNAEVNPKQLIHLFPNNCKDMDIIVIGLQEATYTIGADPNIEPVAPNDNNNNNINGNDAVSDALIPCIAHLKMLFTEAIGSDFELIVHNKRAQMQLYIFARLDLIPYVSDIQICAENTGFLHVFPNKGGISVFFKLDGTSLAFFSSHLAAHEGVFNCYMRNDSVKEIIGGTKAGSNKDLDLQAQCHHIFFMGDMNYRLTKDTDEPNETYEATKKALVESKQKEKEEKEAKKKAGLTDISTKMREDEEGKVEELSEDKKEIRKKNHEEFLNLIKEEKWNKLLEYDELLREVSKGRLLPGFTPCPVSFPPTFKRYRGSKKDPKLGGDISRCIMKVNNDLNNKGKTKYLLSLPSLNINDLTNINNCVDYYYNPQRYPAYTDRILYHSFIGFKNDLIFKNFDSIELIDTSDHKPVCAKFELYTRNIYDDIKVTMNGNKLKTLTLKLKNLKCNNLSELDLAVFGGGSDPYIILSTDPIELINNSKTNILKSTCIDHNLNPEWDKNEFLQIEFVSNDVDSLSNNAHLIIQVWDKDNITEDDLIGCAVVSLKTIFKKLIDKNPISINNNPINYPNEAVLHLKEDLFYAGQKHGTFECDVTLVNDIKLQKKSSNSNITTADRTLTLNQYNKQRNFQNINANGCCVIA